MDESRVMAHFDTLNGREYTFHGTVVDGQVAIAFHERKNTRTVVSADNPEDLVEAMRKYDMDGLSTNPYVSVVIAPDVLDWDDGMPHPLSCTCPACTAEAEAEIQRTQTIGEQTE